MQFTSDHNEFDMLMYKTSFWSIKNHYDSMIVESNKDSTASVIKVRENGKLVA